MSSRKVDCLRSRHAALLQVRAHDPHTVCAMPRRLPTDDRHGGACASALALENTLNHTKTRLRSQDGDAVTGVAVTGVTSQPPHRQRARPVLAHPNGTHILTPCGQHASKMRSTRASVAAVGSRRPYVCHTAVLGRSKRP